MLEKFNATNTPYRYGLPAAAYLDAEFFALENATLFVHNWVFVGFRHELKTPGDVRPVTVGGQPFFLVCQEDGGIAAFHNVCRHRCLQLVDEPGNYGRLIRCPYHSWTYRLDGSLQAAPYFTGHARKPPAEFFTAERGLAKVRCAVWHDWVFINVDGQAMAFADFIAPLERQLGAIDVAAIVPVATIDFGTINSNWKGLMENFIEPYHVQFVHRATTNQPLTDHFTIIDTHCLGSGCDIADSKSVDESGTLAVTSRFLTLFPNFVIGCYAPDQIGVHLNCPIDVGTTTQRRVIYLPKEHTADAEQIERVRDLWVGVHKEDHAICERLQSGRRSPLAQDGGILSPHWENSVRQFQERVIQATDGG